MKPKLTREELMTWAWWIAGLCLQCGSSVSTAYRVAAEFVKGFEEE
jgi:hypothetical protein